MYGRLQNLFDKGLLRPIGQGMVNIRTDPWSVATVGFPILQWLPEVTSGSIKDDLNAGLIVFILLIPQGMAYALLAGLPPVYGLYASTVGLFVYALMGTCREISMGPMAIMSLLTGQAIAEMGLEVESQEWIDTAQAMATIVGLILIVMGALNLGILVNFLSHAVMSSFTTASACIIFVNQIKHILGFSVPRMDYTHQLIYYLCENIGETKWYALLLGGCSVVALYFTREWKRANKPNPAKEWQQALWYKIAYFCANASGLICVLVTGFSAYLLVEEGGYEVHIVGSVPQGLLAPKVPIKSAEQMMELFSPCLVIAVISFMGNWAIAKKFSSEGNYEVSAQQELIAAGMTNFIGSIFNGYVLSAGLSRSAVNKEAGARTPLSGAISATLIIFALLFMTEVFHFIPMAALGAIIQTSVISMINFSDMLYAYKVDKNDFFVMVCTFLFTFFLGIMEGIFVGVILSIIFVVNTTAFPHVAHLGQIKGSDSASIDAQGKYSRKSLSERASEGRIYWRNIERFEEARENQVAGVAVLRMDASIYFANTAFFKQSVLDAAAGRFHCNQDVPISLVVLDLSTCVDIDVSGIFALEALHEELLKQKTFLKFAHVHGPVRDRLFKANFVEKIGSEGFVHGTVDDAITFKRIATAEADLVRLGKQRHSATDDDFGHLSTSLSVTGGSMGSLVSDAGSKGSSHSITKEGGVELAVVQSGPNHYQDEEAFH